MIAATAEQTWFGQPRGLTVLFLTNMWEQFSYYGMRALLVLYMTKQLQLGDGWSSLVYGAYTGCAYLTPIFGGLIADRWLGKRRAIIAGAAIMAAGHFMMAFPALLYAALATIAVGNGLFLPSLPSQVGDLYAPEDPRRSWAYNVYYVGINLGGFLAPFVCGTLAAVYGWHWGFGAAGVGMVAGLLIYLAGGRYLPPEAPRARAPDRTADDPAAMRGKFDGATLLTLAAIALSVIVFRGAYEQVGNALNKWADTGVDRRLGSFTLETAWFQSLNPLFVMVMTPALLAWWARRAARGQAQPLARRMATGALIVGAAYLMLAGVAAMAGGGLAGLWFAARLLCGDLDAWASCSSCRPGSACSHGWRQRGMGATTVAAWFTSLALPAICSARAWSVRLWSGMGHAACSSRCLPGWHRCTGCRTVMRFVMPLEQQVQRAREPPPANPSAFA